MQLASGREPVRTFVAMFLPDDVLRAIADATRAGGTRLPGVRWTTIGNVHLTLRFLGDVETKRVAGVAEALRAAAQGVLPLHLALGAAGAFPSPRAPRVLWVGLTGDTGGLVDFAGRLERELRQRGFGRADKPFSPHLTIGRLRPPVPRVEWAPLVAGLTFPQMAFTLAAASVVGSELSPKGSLYTPLATVPLVPPDAPPPENVVAPE